MIEATLGFFAGLLFNWYAFWIILAYGVWMDHSESRVFAGIAMSLFLFITYHLIDPSWNMVRLFLIGYIPAGFLWSFVRWKRHCDEVVAKSQIESHSKDWWMNKITPSKNTETISYWALFWPLSFIENISSDLLDALEETIRKIAKHTYQKISDSAESRLRFHKK